MDKVQLNIGQLLPDKDLANDGVWTNLLKGVHFKLAYAGPSNEKFRVANTKSALQRGDAKTVDPEDMDKMNESEIDDIMKSLLPVYAKTVVKDWKGLKTTENKDFPYSAENALMVLNAYPDLFDKVILFSRNKDNFLLGDLNGVKKKSSGI